MPICAVRTCGERGQFACKKSEGQIISFHRFPSDPRIKAKWIRATGQRKITSSWQPTKESTICSKHFKREDFLTCTDLRISAVPLSEDALLDDHNEQEFLQGFMNDSVDSSDTDSIDDVIELPQNNESITNKEFAEEDEEIPIEYEPATTTSPHDQPGSDQPIAVQDSEPECSDTSSEIEFTELDSSEAISGQPSVDAIENPQGSDEQTAYGMKISKAYSTRKRPRVQMKDQIKTNIKMYRIDPVTNTVHPVKNIHEDCLLLDPAKPPVIIRHNRNRLGKPLYVIKKSAESLDGNSQKTKVNQNWSSQVQFAKNTTKNMAPETGSNSNRAITLSMFKEEQQKVYLAPVPKLVQINQKLPAIKDGIVQKIWKATKLNSTAGSGEKLRKLKVNSIHKKITPSAKMLTGPNECCRPQLISASSNVSKPNQLFQGYPRPATLMVTPAYTTPTSTVSTPSPAYSMPTPADSMPIPADSTPTPADSNPTPAGSTPTPPDSMVIPADSTITPADSMPTPAVLSPAVQNLDDSNIHTPDEYNTFAKHVATQLRQLSLESFLSAQGEIQSILSRYRLSDLNVIKKNPSL